LVSHDSNTEDKVLPGIIVGENCVKRTLRKKVLPPLPVNTIKSKSIFPKQNNVVKSEVKALTSEEMVKVEKKDGPSQDKNKAKANSQGSIASMFHKAEQIKKTEAKQKALEPKQRQIGGLSSFLTKQPSKEITKDIVNKQQVNERNDEVKSGSKRPNSDMNGKEKSDLFDSDTDEEILKDLHLNEEKPLALKTEDKIEKGDANRSRSKTSQKKKRGKTDIGNDKSAKKRKRIIVDENSESDDDIFGSEKSDNEEVHDFNEDPEPVEIESKPPLPKNKRRKAVKKMYEDEEGFIVTKMEFVYETASEDENEPDNKVPKKEEVKLNPVKKSNKSEKEISPKKAAKSKKLVKKASSGSQSTLMDFFKRK